MEIKSMLKNLINKLSGGDKESCQTGGYSNPINKTELVDILATKTELSKKDIHNVITEFENIVIDKVLNNAHTISLAKFGKFEQKVWKARNGRDPFTGQAKKIPETTMVRFKPYNNLKIKEQ